MNNVLVFFKSEPVMAQKVVKGVTTILRQYPNGEETHLKIMLAGLHSITGDHCQFCVASDRKLMPNEIIEAANRLL
ncbi:hypothetical protein [Kosakonia quasisacchari]|uniref:hypothetical protein n=1 Tax=Kosakonia quasisacchari TaxID=2529380 RepID=UPI0039E1B6B0